VSIKVTFMHPADPAVNCRIRRVPKEETAAAAKAVAEACAPYLKAYVELRRRSLEAARRRFVPSSKAGLT